MEISDMLLEEKGWWMREINPLHPNINMHILHNASIHFLKTDKENLSKNQELYRLVITSLILVTLLFDSGVIV